MLLRYGVDAGIGVATYLLVALIRVLLTRRYIIKNFGPNGKDKWEK